MELRSLTLFALAVVACCCSILGTSAQNINGTTTTPTPSPVVPAPKPVMPKPTSTAVPTVVVVPPVAAPSSGSLPSIAVPITRAPTTAVPTVSPTNSPSLSPTRAPTSVPSLSPSNLPSLSPSSFPSLQPSSPPSTQTPSWIPSVDPQALAPTSHQAPSPTMRPPTFPAPAPFVPYPTGNNKDFDDGDDDDGDGDNAGLFVAIMAIFFLVAICCSWNRGRVELEKYEDAETAVKEFKQDVLVGKFLVFDCFLASCKWKEKKFGCVKKRVALFYSTRIKRRWKPQMAYIQFFFGWVAFFSTIVGLFKPESKGNSIVGSGAMFLNELLLHIWYGYFRYPNLITGGEEDDFFEDIKWLFSILYHKDTEDHSERSLDIICMPFVAVLHLGSVLGIVVSYIACGLLRAVGQDDDNGRRRSRRQQDDEDEGVNVFAILVGALAGSFAYPLLFLVAQNPAWKLVAAYSHHIVEEYYEAKLFRKSPKEFLSKTLFSVLGDLVGVDGLDGLDDAVDAAKEGAGDIKGELSDNLDEKSLDGEETNETGDGPAPTETEPENMDQTAGSSLGDEDKIVEEEEDIEISVQYEEESFDEGAVTAKQDDPDAEENDEQESSGEEDMEIPLHYEQESFDEGEVTAKQEDPDACFNAEEGGIAAVVDAEEDEDIEVAEENDDQESLGEVPTSRRRGIDP